jgi:hypothetical protein
MYGDIPIGPQPETHHPPVPALVTDPSLAPPMPMPMPSGSGSQPPGSTYHPNVSYASLGLGLGDMVSLFGHYADAPAGTGWDKLPNATPAPPAPMPKIPGDDGVKLGNAFGLEGTLIGKFSTDDHKAPDAMPTYDSSSAIGDLIKAHLEKP